MATSNPLSLTHPHLLRAVPLPLTPTFLAVFPAWSTWRSRLACGASLTSDAIRGEHGRDFMGTKIVVEWARGPRDRFEPKEKDVRKRGGGDDFHRRDDDLNRRDDDYPKRGGGDDFHKREYGNGSYDRRSHSRSPVRYREPPRVAVGPRSISPDRRRGEEDFKRQSGRGGGGQGTRDERGSRRSRSISPRGGRY
eukprot:Em0021g54a